MKLYFESNEREHWRKYLTDEAIELAKSGLYAIDIADNLEYNHGVDSDTTYDIAREAEMYVRYELDYFRESVEGKTYCFSTMNNGKKAYLGKNNELVAKKSLALPFNEKDMKRRLKQMNDNEENVVWDAEEI